MQSPARASSSLLLAGLAVAVYLIGAELSWRGTSTLSSGPVVPEMNSTVEEETKIPGSVLDYETNETVEKQTVLTAKMAENLPNYDSGRGWSCKRAFHDGDFIAAGHLIIAPQGRKDIKNTMEHTIIFYVVQGAVQAIIHQTPVIVETGGTFMVPRGNNYSIENLGSQDVKLFFAQGRKSTSLTGQRYPDIS